MSRKGEPRDEGVDRRAFLMRAGKAGAAAAAAAALWGWRFTSQPPAARTSTEDAVSLADFSVASAGAGMSIVSGGERPEALQKALELLGGVEKFIQQGDRVLIKVNAAFATPPALGATTHPGLLSETIRLCRKAGASRVVVTDNPINDPSACFRYTGLGEAAQSAGAELFLPQPDFFQPATLAEGTLIRRWPLLYRPFRDVNKLIGLAPVKDHHRSGASMTMKNWYGLLGGRRNVFHQSIHSIIRELALLARPTLVVLDGTVSMMRNGPTGGSVDDLRATRTLIVSTDQVAADACGAGLLEMSPADLPFLSMAEEAGAGTVDFESLKPQRATLR
jgi:uncharacterized protein (DUF362 family)